MAKKPHAPLSPPTLDEIASALESTPETDHEVAPAVDPAPEREAAAAEPTAATAAVSDDTEPIADHRAVHGDSAIIAPARSDYHIRVGGQRYVHVGEFGNDWVYRPD